MTLIACLSPDTYPVLLADTLLSSASGRSEISLPSVGFRHSQINSGSGLRVWGYEQKCVFIGAKIIAVWAGEYEAAKRILTGVHKFFREGPASAFFLNAYLRAEHPENLKAVSLIFSIMEEAGNIETRWYSGLETVAPPLGQVVFAGSGAGRLRKYLNQLNGPLQQAGNYLRIGATTALILTGCLLADEMATGAPLIDSFGGAYEIASFWDGRTQKLSDCVYLFWFPEQQPDGGFTFTLHPRKIIRRFENNGMTAFYCLENDSSSGATAKVTKEEVFILKPFLRDREEVTVSRELPKLNAQWQVNVFCAKLVTGQHKISAQVNFRHDARRHPVDFLPGKHRLQFKLNMDMEGIRQTVMKLLDRMPST